MWMSKIEPLACMVCELDFPDHFGEWERLADDNRRLLVLCSRDHGKTTFFSKLLPLYRVMKYPGYELCIISYSDKQVMKIITGITDLIDASPMLSQLKPKDRSTAWSKSSLVFPNRSKIDTLSFGASGRGGHYDLVLVDDPVKDFGGMDPEDQERYLKNAVTPMVKPDGQLIMVGNYVYENDLIERTEANKAYTTKVYPAITSGRALWPQRWPVDKLELRRAEVGDFSFSREYLLEKVDPRSQFFKREMISYYDKLPDSLSTVLTVDPAITLNGDATAMVLTGTASDKRTYILEYANMRSDNVQDILDTMFRMLTTWQCKHMIIEGIGFQRLLKFWVYEEMRKRNYHFGIEELQSHSKSKQARIMGLQPMIQAGSLLFHKEHKELIDQLMIFPRGKHDDMIDSLSFAIGFWQAPSTPAVKVQESSWSWWESQLKTPATNYRQNLFADLSSVNRPGNIHLLQ